MLKEFGITRLANVTGLDRVGLPVTLAIRPNSRSVAVSQGKGATLEDAKASALMETIEIWHAENLIIPVYYGSVADLSQVWDFPNLDRLPKPANSLFSPNSRLLWVGSEDLVSEKEKLIPFEMVHADYTDPPHPGQGLFPASTNGLASGNHRLEAICHAITEVVERDALSIWHFTSTEFKRSRRVDVETITDATCIECLDKIRLAGLEFGVWDVTSDIGVACCLCLIHEPDDTHNHLGLGSGCHPDRAIAMRRAITEAAQTRLNYISGSRDDLSLEEYDAHGMDNKRVYAEDMLVDRETPRTFSDIPHQQFATLQEDLNWLLSQLQEAGIEEVCVTDLTRDTYNIPVVRVVIPGLEAPHDETSYVPGPRAEKAKETGRSA